MHQALLLVYGDHLGDKIQPIKRLYREAKTRPLLSAFLRQTVDALRHQYDKLDLRERSILEGFSDLIELAEHNDCQELNLEAVSFALTTAIQVAEFLVQAEEDSGLLSVDGTVRHMGVCIGLLAATVGAASTNISDVFRLGLEMVAVAFRLGVACLRRSLSVDNSNGSWATTFLEVDPDDLAKRLDKVNQALPKLARAYQGVTTDYWTTVFAVPSTTEIIRSSPGLSELRHINIAEARSAVHAPDWPSLPLEWIINSSSAFDLPIDGGLVFPSRSGEFFQTTVVRDCLEEIIADIANFPLQLGKAIRSLSSQLSNCSELQIRTAGPSTSLDSIVALLDEHVPAVRVPEEPSMSPFLVPESTSDLVAVVGMAGRFPGDVTTLEGFWSLLRAGLTTHEEIPSSRFNMEEYYDVSGEGKNAMRTRYGCFLRDPGLFDNLFFNVSPKEAMQMDPLQRMLLMCTYEALQHAGYSSASTSRVSSFFGQTTNDWNTINDQRGPDTFYISGGNRAFAPGRLNHFFNWTGSHYSIDTACSASSTSVHLACDALRRRECDLGVVGGGSLCVIPEMFSGLDNGGFLSPTGGCKTFSDDADGYCRGEAVGVVILKRLDDAVRDNDKVLSVIRGTARNSNGSNGSITYPSAVAQEDLFRTILRQSQVNANEVNYVEMHGTGTQAGDTTEMASVMKVFAQGRAAENPLHVGAVKAAVGHSEAAAGIVALIKTILMLQHSEIPPQPGPLTTNRRFPPLDAAKVTIADRVQPFCAWDGGESVKRRLLVNGFDAAGGNTSILVEDAPFQGPKASDPRSHHVVVVSGRTAAALQRNRIRMLEYLLASQEIRLNDVAYTTTARRLHEAYREAYVADSVDDLIDKLKSTRYIQDYRLQHPGPAKMIFAFTGQSSLYTGMGSGLYKSNPGFKQTLDSYQALCDAEGLASFLGLIQGSQSVETATAAQQQLAIVALEISLAHYWMDLGIKPQLVVGHSLGEFSALCIAGVLSPLSALRLVHIRAELMQASCTTETHGMLATGVSIEEAQQLLEPGRWTSEIACHNAPSMTVLSGELGELRSLAATLKRKGRAAKMLDVEYGFHSRQMEPILEAFEREAASVSYRKPSIPVASTLTGQIVLDTGTFDAAYLRRQTRETVDFAAAVSICENEGYLTSDTVVFEIGPRPICIGLITANTLSERPSCYESLNQGVEDWQSMSRCLAGAYAAGIDVKWVELHKPYLASCQLLDLPSYAFELTNFWVPYRSSDRQISASQLSNNILFITSSVQRLESLKREGGKAKATFRSDISAPGLREAISGHVVNGFSICPASVFMDMALTAAAFTFGKCEIATNLDTLELRDFRITQALVSAGNARPQIVTITAALTGMERDIAIEVRSGSNSTDAMHCTCTVFAPTKEAPSQQWATMRRLVGSRADALNRSQTSHQMATALFYRLFNDVVRYSKPYQCLSDARIAEGFEDGTAKIMLGRSALEETGSFTYNPFVLDALVHLAGFLLNSSFTKAEDDMYLANHVGHLQLFGPLSEKERERTVFASVRQPGNGDSDTSVCDVFIFDHVNGELLATCTDIRFQKMPRDVFSLLLSGQGPTEALPATEAHAADVQRRAKEAEAAPTNERLLSPSQANSELLLRLLADELGLSIASLAPDCEFASIGLHSLASLKIIARFRKQSGRDLPAAFLAEHSTADRVRKVLGEATDSDDESARSKTNLSTPSVAVSPATPLTPYSGVVPASSLPNLAKASYALSTPAPEAKALLIHGDPDASITPLFLATAGIGLAAPYINIPQFPDQRALYALESPFVECPEKHSLNVEHMAATWIIAIRRIRPKGPYLLGGYSAGGVYAYEIARQLAENHGERIAGLLIIDSRVPQPVPSALDIIAVPTNATGLSQGMRQHMIASARALVRYDPRPFPPSNCPARTHLIWAKGGEGTGGYGRAAMGPIGEGRPSRELTFEEYEAELARWFCGDRYDFGTNGWETYVGGERKVVVDTVEGNHGTMMRMPQVKVVGAVVVNFVEQITPFEAAIVADA